MNTVTQQQINAQGNGVYIHNGVYENVRKNKIMAFARRSSKIDIHQVTWYGPYLKRQISQVEKNGGDENFNSKF